MISTEPLRFRVAQSFLNIPNSELEDLMQEGAFLMSKAAIAYTPGGAAFTTYLYSRLEKLYRDMFRAETAEKRNPKGMILSFDQMDSNSEYEEEGNTLEEQIVVDDVREKLRKQIDVLELKARQEKQPRRKHNN